MVLIRNNSIKSPADKPAGLFFGGAIGSLTDLLEKRPPRMHRIFTTIARHRDVEEGDKNA
jgi:hypothetical protein